MRQIILILFIIFNVFNFINITSSYQHDELIAMLSVRIIIMALSVVLSILFLIVGTDKITRFLSILTILSGLLHVFAILTIYI